MEHYEYSRQYKILTCTVFMMSSDYKFKLTYHRRFTHKTYLEVITYLPPVFTPTKFTNFNGITPDLCWCN